MSRKLLLGLMLLALLAVSGVAVPVEAQTTVDTVQVRFVHALPGAGAVDIYVDSDLVVPGAEFGDATPHLNLAAGDHTITVRTAGAPATDPGVFNQTLTLVPDRTGLRQTLIVQAGASNTPEISVNTDDLNPALPGQSRLHIIHAMANIGPVDLVSTNGAPIAQGIAFNIPFGTVNPPVSSWDLAVIPAGGSIDQAIAQAGQVKFDTGMLYTLIVAGDSENPQVIKLATPLNADPAIPSILVRVAHGSSDAPAIDIYGNDDVKLFVGLEPGDVTPHIPLPIGEMTLTVREAGSPPNSEALAVSRINLNSTTGAASVVAVGALSDESFTFSIYEDNLANLNPGFARVRVINTALTGPATVALSNGATLTENLQVFNASPEVDLIPGVYGVAATVASEGGDLNLDLPDQPFIGGTFSTLLLFANASAGLNVSTTAVNLASNSLPGSVVGVAVSAGTPNQNPGTDTTNTTSTDTAAATPDTSLTTGDGSQNSTTSLQSTPTPPPPAAVTPAPAPNTPAQQVNNKVIGLVDLNQGVNLQCREYPSPTAFSLGLIPNGVEVEIRGYAGPADPEIETPFVPVEEGSFAEPETAESFEEVWLSIYWLTPDGGTIDCWVRGDFLRITFRNRFIRETVDFFALEDLDLPVPIISAVPFNDPAEPLDTVITPPTPIVQLPIATVNVNSGVSLHIRRQPDATSESLARAPSGTGLVIIERTESITEVTATPEVGEGTPTPTPLPEVAWLFVEYTAPEGVVTRGWVSSEFVLLSLGGRRLELTDIPIADFIQSGEVIGTVGTGTTSTTPVPTTTGGSGAGGPITGIVNIPQGANLNMYDSPSTSGTLVRSLGSGATVTVLGRNSDSSWLNVRYEALGEGTWVGWVSNSGGWITLPVPVESLPITG